MLGTFADFPLRIFAIWYLSYLSSGRRIKEWNKFEKIYSNKISGDNAQEEWGKVTSLAYRTLGRPRLVGFFVPVLALFESQRGSKIYSNKISWNLLKRGNWLQQVLSNMGNSQVPPLEQGSFCQFVRLFIQVKISATSLDRQRGCDANTAPCYRHSVSV